MFGYDRPSSSRLREQNARKLDNPAYDRLFESDNFSYEDLLDLTKKNDPFITRVRPEVGDQSGIGRYQTFADVSNANNVKNSLKVRFAKAKDKKAFAQRVEALKELGLSDAEAVQEVNNPKYEDYFAHKDLAPRVTTYVQPTVTADSRGETISDRQSRQKRYNRFDETLDLGERKARREMDIYLDRRDAQLQQDLDYQTALRDEGIKRDYFDPSQTGGRSRSGTRTGNISAEDRKAQEEYLGTVEEARRQNLLADRSGLPSGSRPEDEIGQSIAKRYFRSNAGYAGLEQLDREIQNEAAQYGTDVEFDSRSGQYIPKLVGSPEDYGRTQAAQSLNAKLRRGQEIAAQHEEVLKDAEANGLVLKDGRFHDLRGGGVYQYQNNPNEEEAYFADLPVNQPEVDYGNREARARLTPEQRVRIARRTSEVPGLTEENYPDRFDYYAGEVTGGNPLAAHSSIAQADDQNRRIMEIKNAIDKGLVRGLDMDQFGYDSLAAARAIYQTMGRVKARQPINYIGNTRY